MRTRQLGTTDLHLTTVGFGAWAIGGGDWAFGWGPQDDAESVRAIHRALDLGVNWIDTAAVYGLRHSEEVVARALQRQSNRNRATGNEEIHCCGCSVALLILLLCCSVPSL